jgi:hypothetical protein
MPIAPETLFSQAGASYAGVTRWGVAPASTTPGVYALSLSNDPACGAGVAVPAISSARVAAWIARVPAIRLDGEIPRPTDVAAHIATYWHAGESIVYIGKATSLRRRLREYFSHTLGNRSPHAGGHWLKTLDNLGDLWIHFAECSDEPAARSIERDALAAFQRHVLSYSPRLDASPRRAIPFANRAYGGRKQTRLSPETL